MLPGETNRGFGHVDMSKIVYDLCFYDNMETIHVVEFVDNIFH